jgi:peptidyl-prolyl cis-trans isomerase SurA
MRHKLASLLGTLFFTFGLSAQNDPVIMTINGEPVYKSEFEYIYNKNNSSNALDKKSLDEYVELFVNFKLKVAEAKSKGIHHKKSYVEELETYRNQLAAPYMADKETEEEILKEAYARMKEDVETSHILIKCSRTDTTEAYKKIYELFEKLRKGADFSALAIENSECPSASKGGHLGYITAFLTVYPFETVAYNTPKGSFSAPVRTSFGYHIVKVHNRRPTKGSVHVAHIFKRTESENTAEQMKQKTDSLYQLLKNGADFEKLAKQYSDDRQSAERGGDMGWIETGRLPVEFEDAAFNLKNNGELSSVIKTSFGYHILKRLDKKGLDSYENLRDELKGKIFRDERANLLNDSYIEKLKQKHGFRPVTGALTPFYQLMDLTDEKEIHSAYLRMDNPLYMLNGKHHSQKDFAEYFKTEKEKLDKKLEKNASTNKGKSIDPENSGKNFVDKTFAQYTKKVVVAEEQIALEKEHPEYRNLLREYSDGLLLFEVSNEEVWNKASTDVDGLEKFFETKKENYKWESPRFRGKILYCVDKKVLADAQKFMKTAHKDSVDIQLKRKFNTNTQQKGKSGKSNVQLKIENGLYTQGANKAVDAYIFKKETYTDDAFPAVACIGGLIAAPESYKDVRGPATADYQNYLEEEWIKSLRNKYEVVINKEVLKTVKSN